jgi:2-oxoglutarate dehydrogenase E1 component
MRLSTRYNADLLDDFYNRWRQDPASVDDGWAAFFEGFELGQTQLQRNGAKKAEATAAGEAPLQTRVDGLVYAYRTLGHTVARLDPLTEDRPEQPLLSLRELGFSEKDLDLEVSSKFYLGGRTMTLRDMIASLQQTYSGTIGVEFMHIQNTRVRNWVRESIESNRPGYDLSTADKKHILQTLLTAESFEHFLHTKYVGQKRFSLEGGESLMVILDTLFERCPGHGIQEIAMGMAHRGRLNVLANFLKKSLTCIFNEFSENYIPQTVGGDGDVKYHLGYEMTRETMSGAEVAIRLSANPSHLEAVDPVVQGMARARQRLLNDTKERRKVLPLLLHGDAAFAGQGLVAEVLNMSQLPGYETGGTVHVVVNNQIGFTTLPADARSSVYATDVAKMIEAPIFHVNGDDPIAVAFVTALALEFRQKFRRDVVIDMYCYRRHGHNEGDEPVFTQPSLYAEISTHPSVATLFRNELIASQELSQEESDTLEREFRSQMEAAFAEVKKAQESSAHGSPFEESTAVFQPPFNFDPVETGVPREQLDKIVKALTTVPPDFRVLPKIKRTLLDRRAQAFLNGGPIDWAFAEALAFGSLLSEGTPVRLSGQDSRRGTFSQRHSVLYDQVTRERYIPLLNISPDQARFCVYNSLLSEQGVLGFDYGYSLNCPQMLCLWEAQFGDFANGAQVIIDQFVVSSESKWQRPSSIVLLLPHGYEGQGPEHSSARLERFLQLCAEDNIQVCNLTTPAQYFHILRRQMKRPFRKPLIIMTPKSLLRAEFAVSKVEDLIQDRFHEILPAPLLGPAEEIDRVIFCSGKVYYDLLQHREKHQIRNAAIIRIEQLYPLHTTLLQELAAPFSNASKWVWCQEESQNMGAWMHVGWQLRQMFNQSIFYAGRNASSSPAVGSKAVHDREQKLIVEDAFQL